MVDLGILIINVCLKLNFFHKYGTNYDFVCPFHQSINGKFLNMMCIINLPRLHSRIEAHYLKQYLMVLQVL
jgi:hypothetical protein